MTDVEVVCLPKYLPEYLEIDVVDLELDAMMHLSDIPLPEGVVIPELQQGPEHDHAVVSIHVIKVAPIEEELDEEAEGEEGAAEGEEPEAGADEGGESTDE